MKIEVGTKTSFVEGRRERLPGPVMLEGDSGRAVVAHGRQTRKGDIEAIGIGIEVPRMCCRGLE